MRFSEYDFISRTIIIILQTNTLSFSFIYSILFSGTDTICYRKQSGL